MKINTSIPFIACDHDYAAADIVIFGAPFDGTTSFRPGTRFGPQAIRQSSADGIETYSPYQDKDLEDLCICDIGDLEFPFGNTKAVLDLVEQTTKTIVQDGKLPVMIGGEHLVSLGAVRGLYDKYPDVHVIHLDAHADMRDAYLGQTLSHATVMRRIWDIVGDNRIYQFGIRSAEHNELQWAKRHVHTRMFDCDGFDAAISRIAERPIYLSIDLDVLDPSFFPGTGTPEAGGISFTELINTIFKVSGANIVGVDLNELSPPCDHSGVSTLVACKVLRELLLSL